MMMPRTPLARHDATSAMTLAISVALAASTNSTNSARLRVTSCLSPNPSIGGRISSSPMLVLPFAPLHTPHNACKFARVVSPPLDSGTMWSQCNDASSAMPQPRHRPLSRAMTWGRNLSVFCFLVFVMLLLSAIGLTR